MNALLEPTKTPGQAKRPDGALSVASLLRLLQLSCPTLPIGAYAYSQGLEAAFTTEALPSEGAAIAWISGVLSHGVQKLDLPVLARLYAAWESNNAEAQLYWTQFLCASRESRELLMEEEHLGESLRKVLCELGVVQAQARDLRPTYLSYFALGAVHFNVPLRETLCGYAFAWAEHQVSAASRLVAFGPMASQRVLSQVLALIPAVIEGALALEDDQIGASLPRLALGSARHETQYCRIFRS